MLDQGDHPAGHETGRPDRGAAPGQLAHLDESAPADYLHPPPGAGGHDVIGSRHITRVHHDLDPIALHVGSRPDGGMTEPLLNTMPD